MIVYALTNQRNHKIYIGQTKHCNLTRRWSPSLANSRNPHLKAAIDKHGAKAFRREVLASTLVQQEADLLEKFYIAAYQTTNPRFGYNLQFGGLKGTGRHTQETIQRIREGNKRHWQTKSREFMIQYAENARLRWDMWPEERKQEWAETCRARWWGRSEEERTRILELAHKNTIGKKRSVPGWNKGLMGWNAGYPKSAVTRERLSIALRRYWAEKRMQNGVDLSKELPRQGQRKDGDETQIMTALREIEQTESKLREIQKRLEELKFELGGGCLW
jgi:group I intron endonuclease